MKITDGLTGRGRPLLLHVREAAVNAPARVRLRSVDRKRLLPNNAPPKPPMIFDRMGKEEIETLFDAAE